MKLLILGAGGHGQVVGEIAEATNLYADIKFLDDTSQAPNVIGKLEDYQAFADQFEHAIVALGNNSLRLEWLDKLVKVGYRIPVLSHPTAYISPSANLLLGTVVEAKAVVNTKAVVHKGSIIDVGAIVDHDATIEEGCHIDCGAIIKAYVRVEGGTKVEAGVVVRNV